MTDPAADRAWCFDDQAGRYDDLVASGHPLYGRYNQVLDAVVAAAKVASGMRVLDVGAGTGNLALRCLQRGAAVVGLDPSEPMLAKARRKTPPDATAEFIQVQQPFLRAPLPDASFDAVVSTYAYHHVPSRLKPAAVREAFRVIKPGGMWVVGDLIFADAEAERAALRQFRWLEQEYFARIDEHRALLAELGAELIAEQFTPVTWVIRASAPLSRKNR